MRTLAYLAAAVVLAGVGVGAGTHCDAAGSAPNNVIPFARPDRRDVAVVTASGDSWVSRHHAALNALHVIYHDVNLLPLPSAANAYAVDLASRFETVSVLEEELDAYEAAFRFAVKSHAQMGLELGAIEGHEFAAAAAERRPDESLVEAEIEAFEAGMEKLTDSAEGGGFGLTADEARPRALALAMQLDVAVAQDLVKALERERKFTVLLAKPIADGGLFVPEFRRKSELDRLLTDEAIDDVFRFEWKYKIALAAYLIRHEGVDEMIARNWAIKVARENAKIGDVRGWLRQRDYSFADIRLPLVKAVPEVEPRRGVGVLRACWEALWK